MERTPKTLTIEICSACGAMAGASAHSHRDGRPWEWRRAEYEIKTPRLLYEAADVTPDVLAAAEDVWDGWFADSPRIDWDEFIDRLVSRVAEIDVEDMASPAVAKIQRHVRALARDAT